MSTESLIARQKRLIKAQSIQTHTRVEWLAVLAEVNCHCVICGRFTTKLTKDHIIPLYLGGHDGITNLPPVCRPCNSGRYYDEFNWLEYRRANGWPELGQLEFAFPKLKRDRLLCLFDWEDKYRAENESVIAWRVKCLLD